MTRDLYECPRCGYTSSFKQSMCKHLYIKKKVCQAIKNSIELTDDVKGTIIECRRYRLPEPPPPPPTINQQINNYQQINNIIGKMDVLDKHTKYMEYYGEALLNFDDHVTMTYQDTIDKLDQDTYKDFAMNHKTFYEIIDTLTACASIEKLNVLYDEQSQKLRFVELGDWKSKLLETGVDEIVSRIKDGYLDYYEDYLLRKYPASDLYTRQRIKERLEDYYKFVVCFDLPPCIEDPTYLDDPLMEVLYESYRAIKNELRKVDERCIRRGVIRIIHRNTKANLVDLNKRIMDIIQVDEAFKIHVLDQFTKFTLEHPDLTHF